MKTKLILGTVQLGMNYGVNNTTGQPDKDEAFSILDAALAGGIDTFDTAYGYGTAEDILGEWMESRSLAGRVRIISKIGKLDEMEKSLKRLKVGTIDGYLLHSPQDMGRSDVMDGLRKVKRVGLVKHVGVSVYDEAEAVQAVELGVDYVQVPYNVFDQRLDRTDFFALARKNSVTVFARSPLLQGLLLMEPERIPPHLSHARPLVEQFANIAKRYELSRLEATLLFAYQSKADHVVFGVDTLAQLEKILGMSERFTTANPGYIKEIREAFQNVDRSIVNPSLWSKIKLGRSA